MKPTIFLGCILASSIMLSGWITSSCSAVNQGGGYGGMGMGDGGMGYGEAYGPAPPLKFLIREGKTERGNTKLKQLTASRVLGFQYQLGTLTPNAFSLSQSEDGGGYGEAMYGGEMGGGYGEMGGGYDEMGGYGGMAAGYGDMGGYGSGAPGARPSQSLVIYAYVFDKERVDGRTRIELVTHAPNGHAPEMTRGGGGLPGGLDGGYGGDFGSEGGGEGYGEDFGGGDFGDDGGEGFGAAPLPQFVRLSALVAQDAAGAKKKHPTLTQPELRIVSDTIRQKIWKADAVKSLNQRLEDPEAVSQTERLLKELLSEEYETQLARQEIEVQQIESRVKKLRNELARRRAAKDRVIEVKLGNIVLQAQGLLNR